MIPDTFNPVNVTDTCAVWHLIGADTLFRAARRVNIAFIITPTVRYECFIKTRGRPVTAEMQALRTSLSAHLEKERVAEVSVSIAALQQAVAAAKRGGWDKRVGQGELSCAALARSLGHPAVLTDNRRDFRVISDMVDGRLQKTPQLLGWLYVEGHLTDSDVAIVMDEHNASNGHMPHVYKQAHKLACEKRLMRQMSAASADVER